MNNDPNLTLCGRMADKTVKLTFGQWDYRKEIIVVVKGNTRGQSVINSAVTFAYDDLPYRTVGGRDCAEIQMVNPAGETLGVEDDDCNCEHWLGEMLIAAEIVDIRPESPARTPENPS